MSLSISSTPSSLLTARRLSGFSTTEPSRQSASSRIPMVSTSGSPRFTRVSSTPFSASASTPLPTLPNSVPAQSPSLSVTSPTTGLVTARALPSSVSTSVTQKRVRSASSLPSVSMVSSSFPRLSRCFSRRVLRPNLTGGVGDGNFASQGKAKPYP